jgi:hypothetical protein
MAIYKNIKITQEFLDTNPNAYFIFGDNLERWGHGGAARLRDHPHAIGFITKNFQIIKIVPFINRKNTLQCFLKN